MSYKSHANSSTGNTAYWEKETGSGLSINTAVIYPDLKIKDFASGNPQSCSDASLLCLAAVPLCSTGHLAAHSHNHGKVQYSA